MQMKDILVFLLTVLFPIWLQAQNATDIVKKSEDNLRGKSTIAEMSLKVVRPTWNRTMHMKSWMKGNDYAVILIQSPAKDKGTAFLKRNKEVWNWLPTLERTIKLPPSMMSQSWMGTDFTNDDLVKESSATNDYTHKLLGEEPIDGILCYKIEFIPKPDAAVVWGKIISWIDKQNYLQLRTEFYDEDGYLVNTMRGSKVQKMGGRLIPTFIEMIPADKEGHRTEITYKAMQFNPEINDNFFTTQNLKKVK